MERLPVTGKSTISLFSLVVCHGQHGRYIHPKTEAGKELNIYSATEEVLAVQLHSSALRTALPTLSALTKLHLELHKYDGDINENMAICDAIPSLTALRYLSLDLFNQVEVPSQWSNLGNLTALRLAAHLNSYAAIATISNLRSLSVDFYGFEPNELDPLPALILPGCLTGLTRLEISSAKYLLVENLPALLPKAALEGMRGLVRFHLWMAGGLSGRETELVFAESMPNLTRLEMRGCGMHRIPPFLPQLPLLQVLDLVNNNGLQLQKERDLELLTAAPRLRELRVASLCEDDGPTWSMATCKALMEVRAKLPHLRLVLDKDDFLKCDD